MGEIQDRIKEVLPKDIQKAVYRLVEKGELKHSGGRKHRQYELSKKK